MFPVFHRNSRLPLGVEFSDFQLGYQILDGRTLDFMEQLDRNELALEEAQDSGESFVHIKSSDDRATTEIITNLETLQYYIPSIYETVAVRPDGTPIQIVTSPIRALISRIDKRIEEAKFAWTIDQFGVPNFDDNKECISDFAEEMTQDLFKLLGVGFKLAERREGLREFWNEKTDSRFNWILSYADKLNSKSDLVEEYAKMMVKGISSRTGDRLSKEEVKLIWSTCGLLTIGYDPKFAPISPAQPLEKPFWRAIGQYVWWSLFAKMKEETRSDGHEPLEISAIDDSNGPHYTIDYNDIMKTVYESNGEAEFKTCFNTFHYKDQDEKEQTKIYRIDDAKEHAESLRVSIKTGDWILGLFNKGVNLHKFRIKSEGHPANGKFLLAYIDFLAGKSWTTKIVEFEGSEIECKKMSPRVLTDYHRGQLSKIFWALYNSQVASGIIVKTKQEQPSV